MKDLLDLNARDLNSQNTNRSCIHLFLYVDLVYLVNDFQTFSSSIINKCFYSGGMMYYLFRLECSGLARSPDGFHGKLHHRAPVLRGGLPRSLNYTFL